MSLEFKETGDLSHTLYSTKYGAHYHSLFGAIEESIHVFISAGLFHLSRTGLKNITILEMGLGTGLNAFLSLLEAERSSLSLNYISVESDPLTQDEAAGLNYPSILAPEKSEQFNRIHNCEWGAPIELSENFTFLKLRGNIEDLALDYKLDVIYFDAFAPTIQPHLWEHELHKKLYDRLNRNGCLVTYCSKGSFRRCLTEIGYKIDRLNGPGKKREMLRGIRVS